MLHWQEKATTATIVPFAGKSRDTIQSLASMLDGLGTLLHFPRNAEVFAEGEPADHVYKVATGAVRICKLMSDGRRLTMDLSDPSGERFPPTTLDLAVLADLGYTIR